MTRLLVQYRKFRNFIGPEVWRLLMLVVALGIFLFAVETSFVFILQGYLRAVGVITANSVQLLPSWFPTSIVGASMTLVIFGVSRGFAVMMRAYFSGITSQVFIGRQKERILERALRSENRESTFEIITIFNDNVASAGQVIQNISLLVCNSVCILLFSLYGLIVAPAELIIGSILLGIFIYPTKILDTRIAEHGQAIYVERETVNRTLLLGLRNNFFLKVYGLIESEIARGHLALTTFVRRYKQFNFLSTFRIAYPLALGAIVISIVTLISLTFIKTPGMILITFFYVFVRLSQTLSESYSVLGEVRLHLPAFKALYQWNQKEFMPNEIVARNIPSKPSAVISTPEAIQIDIQNVSFAYGSKTVLANLNLSMKPHQVSLIKGESGAGKSTLLSLIVGILRPTAGVILINGQPAHLVAADLAPRIGYVGPDPYLIPGTVRENLLYGLPAGREVSDQAIWQVLREAHIDAEIQKFGRKLDEHVFEWAQLSTGQRQRLSIARALLRQPSLLVLDEATANLDEDTELRIFETIRNFAKVGTVLIVSHKRTFDAVANQIIKL
ncbi:MAG: ATP-binding cassette domain-containing protein [Bdellovibrio sp.]